MEVAITKISENGQIVIPSEIRKDAHIKPSTKFLVFNEDSNIFLKPVTKDKLKEEIRIMKDIEEGERDLREGRYTEVDSSLSAEEIDKILMEE